MASARRNSNFIASIESENGVTSDHKQVELAFVKYFKDSFNGLNTIPIKHFGIHLKALCQDSRSLLEARFSEREVWEAISSADGNRAPSPDGFNLEFFKRFWPQMKNGIMKLFNEFYKGFSPEDWFDVWRKWIRLRISTPSISVLINGTPSKKFNIKKGLRQGCPLSPLLFNLVREGLSALIHKAMEVGVLKGVQVGNSSLKISHIQFADDLLLFGYAKEEEVLNMKRLLRIFGLCSGLKLNLEKTKLFGVNVDRARLDRWAEKVNCSCESLPTVYLGLPLGVLRNAKEIWEPIIQKVQKRLDGWMRTNNTETLAKSVLSSLPIHYLSIFQMPASIAAKLNSFIAKYIWGNKEGRSIHWVKWDSVCKPKLGGGLGLWDLRLKNRALLNKWIWRYGEETESLWRKVVDVKYGYDLHALIHVNGVGKVKEFGVWRSNGWEWKIELRRRLFDWEVSIGEEFLSTVNKVAGGSHVADQIMWVGASNGSYSTKAFCEVNSKMGVECNNFWKEVWSNLAPPKVEAFVWRAIHQRILASVELMRRRVSLNGELNRPMCGTEAESVSHSLLYCNKVWAVWQKWCLLWNVNLIVPAEFKVFVQVWFKQSLKPECKLV
ncbi:hypothetical protein GQ457_10G006520 [Hibiscus cannabinus]